MSKFFAHFRYEPSAGHGVPLKLRIMQALVATPGIFFLFLALQGTLADYRNAQDSRRRAEVRTALAEATIVEAHDLISGKGHRIKDGAGTFSFSTPSGQEIQVHYRGFSGSSGAKLPVRYDPRHPENCTLGDNRVEDPYLIGNAPFFLFGSYFLFLAVRLGRRNA